MSDISKLSGCGTALVTPFNDDFSIDERALRRFVDFQISEGIDFLVPCGTTGESPTLSDAEQRRVVEIVVEVSNRRVPVIAGAGGNNTAHVIKLASKRQQAISRKLRRSSIAFRQASKCCLVTTR
jgi:4-hydroxy-tetrahydrodipicolinate synthase